MGFSNSRNSGPFRFRVKRPKNFVMELYTGLKSSYSNPETPACFSVKKVNGRYVKLQA